LALRGRPAGQFRGAAGIFAVAGKVIDSTANVAADGLHG
jgi:hypothetical protein